MLFNNLLSEPRELVHSGRTRQEGGFGGFGETQRGLLDSLAQIVRSLHQDVDAVGADATNQEGGHQTKIQAGVEKGHRHSQDAAPKGSFQKMNEGIHIPMKNIHFT